MILCSDIGFEPNFNNDWDKYVVTFTLKDICERSRYALLCFALVFVQFIPCGILIKQCKSHILGLFQIHVTFTPCTDVSGSTEMLVSCTRQLCVQGLLRWKESKFFVGNSRSFHLHLESTHIQSRRYLPSSNFY